MTEARPEPGRGDLFSPAGGGHASAPAPAAEAGELASAASSSNYCSVCSFDPCACALLAEPDECPVCGLDPCGCGVEVLAIDDVIPIYDAPPGYEPAAPAPAEQLAAWRSPAIAAFIDRRAAIDARHGARAVTDASRPPAAMAQDLKERACALLDRLSGRRLDAERAGLALNTLATIGALALALHERLSAGCERPALGAEGGPGADAAGGEAASNAITADDSAGSRP